MSVMGLLFVFIASVAVSWLWREGVLEAPWIEEGETPAYRGARGARPKAAKVALTIFIAVALCLFTLMSAAFFMRMASPDWQAPPLPRILWFGVFALASGSAALEVAREAATADDLARARTALLVAAMASLFFLLGQLWAWRDMVASGFLVARNPANAFFYLLTGAHGLHMIGGLVVLGIACARTWRSETSARVAPTIALGAAYWHFLLIVWLLLFAMLAGWADGFGTICRRLLS